MTVGQSSKALNKLTALKGVGPAIEKKLNKLGINTPADLFFIIPFRYEDRTQITPIGSLIPGHSVVVEAELELCEIVYRPRRTLLCIISDGTGQLNLRFFYFSRSQKQNLTRGKILRCYGEVRKGSNGLEIIHPEYSLISKTNRPKLEKTLTPIYPSTEGLSQPRLRNLIRQILENTALEIQELLPKEICEQFNLPPLKNALKNIHQPPYNTKIEDLRAGQDINQNRLALEEILAHYLGLKQIRNKTSNLSAYALKPTNNLIGSFINSLEFKLTNDQLLTIEIIKKDLTAPHPMMRLVQGDVGCGKTIVAVTAALQAISAGHQAALMAPTELLAEQHRDNLSRWLRPLNVKIIFLSGSLKGQSKNHAYQAIASGEAQLIIGTHALFQESVKYRRLSLVIVDEQHRFGVHQRLSLMQKGSKKHYHPHQLVMTATPIPRTLAMTMYADLDVSVIKELPPGRQAVKTIALSDKRRENLINRVKEACLSGQQAYWVCPLIEESENLKYRDAESTFTMLRKLLPNQFIGLIHGRMTAIEKETVMKDFSRGKHNVLVATTVIEVGVDVPEATLMIIENSERMGLAQLHQLRGRVGRGNKPSSCVLIYKTPLSKIARTRLAVLRDSNDGFIVAQKDLELRGPGEVLGKKQTGLMQMKIGDLIRDSMLLTTVQEIGELLLANHPKSVTAIKRRWLNESSEYGNV
ncbi:MAG: ATP-dependent DNA helicase RecG [Pseudomonadota bacterium]|nr:ATP-dependent DNA helicase RecG [Pseudomonadota bacterium]